MDLSKYIKIMPSPECEQESLQQVEEAMQWFASTPEGLPLMKKVAEKYENPIPIYVGSDVESNALAHTHDMIVMKLNPLLAEDVFPSAKKEDLCGLKSVIAHEYVHANQDLNVEETKKYEMEKGKTGAAIEERYVIGLIDVIRNVVRTASDVNNLPNLIRKTYDKYYADNREDIHQDLIDAFDKNADIKSYVERYETPAVAFENHMRTTYNLGPMRNPDFIKSMIIETDFDENREGFVSNVLEAIGWSEDYTIKSNEASFWRDLINDEGRRSSLAFTSSEHPLIARHNDGGRA